ncbi:response regulator transcription factor [Halocella sp. SP3-1]|uniref:response regulator transcription factor n=1 Tax=Halocella sp. SP3-1 TaxID=2382161 RepID=UPI000F75752B|nr:response regulator transcription factor [Halocella sp. SP3-1]AZO96418.1 DNA-binding response regulator [Halocella sp. SP3-1]MTI59528.1 response regulator transcription factor [Bacillota bacterium]
MSRSKVLIIDDDQHICQILKEYFEYDGFEVIVVHDGKTGLEKVQVDRPDIIVLDIMLPELTGWEVCQELRPQNRTPIIFLSAKNEETDRITGLEIGGDDYVSKPFSPKEVVVRAKSILRRIKQDNEENQELKFPDLIINRNLRLVKVEGKEINLTPKEFDLLWILATVKKVFARENLLNKVWDYQYYGDVRTVDTHIKSLRKKLGDPVSSYIKTVWGIGYKFEVDED